MRSAISARRLAGAACAGLAAAAAAGLVACSSASSSVSLGGPTLGPGAPRGTTTPVAGPQSGAGSPTGVAASAAATGADARACRLVSDVDAGQALGGTVKGTAAPATGPTGATAAACSWVTGDGTRAISAIVLDYGANTDAAHRFLANATQGAAPLGGIGDEAYTIGGGGPPVVVFRRRGAIVSLTASSPTATTQSALEALARAAAGRL